ncbi:MAG: CapA family protein [Chloroflexota bacterium]
MKGSASGKASTHVTLFMCGDVMTGRGIDQVLPHPVNPVLYEPYMKSAAAYVALAEKEHGDIPKPVAFSYIWGDALTEFRRMNPDVKIINLETAVTRSEEYLPKGINYRMHPENIRALTAANIDVCALANNHVLDWGPAGLIETLETLKKVGIKTAGVGRNLKEAEDPVVVQVAGKGRIIVISLGSGSSGIPSAWAASENMPGVNYLKDLSEETVFHIKEKVGEVKEPGDIVVASIHWGGNWGYDIPDGHRDFAHKLIDVAGVDVIHGHSSHHVKGIEVYKAKLILYGCGDLLTDYEGIGGYEFYRGDLGLMYFATVDPMTGKLLSLHMTPTQMKRFRITRASRADARWLRDVLNREGKVLGTRVDLKENDTLELKWE